MAKKKWLGIGAVATAIGAGAALVVRKVRQSPEAASNLAETVAKKSKVSSEKLVSAVGSALGRKQQEDPSDGGSVDDEPGGEDDVENAEDASEAH